MSVKGKTTESPFAVLTMVREGRSPCRCEEAEGEGENDPLCMTFKKKYRPRSGDEKKVASLTPLVGGGE